MHMLTPHAYTKSEGESLIKQKARPSFRLNLKILQLFYASPGPNNQGQEGSGWVKWENLGLEPHRSVLTVNLFKESLTNSFSTILIVPTEWMKS